MPSGDLPNQTSQPDPEVIRETAREVLARPEFELDPLREEGTVWWDLVLDALRWVLQPFGKLFGWLSGISPVLAWVVIIALFLIALALIVHIVYTFKTVLGRKKQRTKLALSDGRRRHDPNELEQQARAAAAEGDWIFAIRSLFKAGLVRLADWEDRNLRPGVTNREHMRHYQNAPVLMPLRTFVDTIDTKWYGRGVCHQDDYQRCAEAHEQICQWIRSTSHDHRA
jgi:hypothetical protein